MVLNSFLLVCICCTHHSATTAHTATKLTVSPFKSRGTIVPRQRTLRHMTTFFHGFTCHISNDYRKWQNSCKFTPPNHERSWYHVSTHRDNVAVSPLCVATYHGTTSASSTTNLVISPISQWEISWFSPISWKQSHLVRSLTIPPLDPTTIIRIGLIDPKLKQGFAAFSPVPPISN